MTETVATLKAVGKEELAVELCGQIAKSDEDRLRLVLKLVASVVGGGERVAPKPPGLASSQTTFEQFGRKWTSNDLAREYRSLPEGSIVNVAALIRRLCRLAVYPGKLVKLCPLPPGWAPVNGAPREKSYIFPSEETKLLSVTEIPLVRRLLYGFINREGPRKDNAVTIEWPQVTIDGLPDGGGHIVLDTSKNGRGGSWALD